MKTLYIECNMGAAGDMLTAALMELLEDADAFVETMNGIGVPGMVMERMEKVSCGVRGTHVSVKIGDEEEISDDVHPDDDHDHDHHEHHHHHHEHHHSHSGLEDVQKIVARLNLPDVVKKDVLGVYTLIAQAEAWAHGCDVTKIHFHEVGMMDAVTDISAVCLLMHMLNPEYVVVSPVTTGFGEVRCMHGVVPVPAPATAYLLQGMPAQAGRIRGELLTPTGAALLKYFADSYGWMPAMQVEKIGCGMGMKQFETANCVRAMIGEIAGERSDVSEISCNLDDMSGEAIAYAAEILLEEGALDVYSEFIQMKKGRPAVKLNCICRTDDKEKMAQLMLKHTSTIGVRMQDMERRVLERGCETVHTRYGDVEVKRSWNEDIHKAKPEYNSAAKLAREKGVPLADIMNEAMRNL